MSHKTLNSPHLKTPAIELIPSLKKRARFRAAHPSRCSSLFEREGFVLAGGVGGISLLPLPAIRPGRGRLTPACFDERTGGTPISIFVISNLTTKDLTLSPASDPRDDRAALMAAADRLADPRVEEYFTGNGHRLAAARAMLDLFDLPPPGWAQRSPSGRAAVTKAAMARFRDDHPQERLPRGYTPPRQR